MTDLDSHLQNVFERVRSSERYSMLKSVLLAAALPSGAPPDVASLTIEAAVSMPPRQFIELCGSDEGVVKAAASVLSNFFPAVKDKGAPRKKTRKAKVIGLGRSPAEQLPGVESIEATQRLLGIVDELKRLPNINEAANVSIEQYWDPAWPQSPFEQSLKIKQILSLDVYSFVRKRSMSAQKTAAFISAMERVLSTLKGGRTVQPFAGESAGFRNTASIPALWNREGISTLPLHCISFLNMYESEASKTGGDDSAFAKIMKAVPAHLSAREFLALWFLQEHSSTVVSELLGQKPKDLAAMERSAEKKMIVAVEASATSELAAMRGLLTGAGQSIQLLCELFGCGGIDPIFQSRLARLVIHTTGARPVECFGVTIDDYWSANGRYAALTFEMLWDSLPKPDLTIRNSLKVMFPGFPMKKLIEIFELQGELKGEPRAWRRRRSKRR
ncbi:MAG: hypothetical protein J5J00_02375 [Deltaproteobacteria bacterium]|nr:hypothetical protein [Deltaproteobacteria bacterium]